MRSIMAGAAVLAGGALLIAGCSSGGSSLSSAIVRRLRRLGKRRGGERAGDRAARLPGEHHARACAYRGEERLLHQGARLGGHGEDDRVHQRHAGDDRDPGRPARRRLRGAEPGDQRLAEVRRPGHQDRLRGGHRRGVRRGEARPSPPPRSSRGSRWPAPRSATPRTWRCATGSSSRGSPPARPAAATWRQADRAELGRRARVQVRADRRRLRAVALRRGDGEGRREGAAVRAGRDDAARWSPSRSSPRTRTIVADLLKANLEALGYIKSDPSGAEQAADAELAAYTGKAMSAMVVDPAFKEINFTDDPDAASLTQDAQQATAVGLLKNGQPERDVRPGPAQLDPHRGRPADGERR